MNFPLSDEVISPSSFFKGNPGVQGSNMFFKVLKYTEYVNISVKSRLGEDFLFWEETYESSKNFRYLFFYLIIVILGVVYDKI